MWGERGDRSSTAWRRRGGQELSPSGGGAGGGEDWQRGRRVESLRRGRESWMKSLGGAREVREWRNEEKRGPREVKEWRKEKGGYCKEKWMVERYDSEGRRGEWNSYTRESRGDARQSGDVMEERKLKSHLRERKRYEDDGYMMKWRGNMGRMDRAMREPEERMRRVEDRVAYPTMVDMVSRSYHDRGRDVGEHRAGRERMMQGCLF